MFIPVTKRSPQKRGCVHPLKPSFFGLQHAMPRYVGSWTSHLETSPTIKRENTFVLQHEAQITLLGLTFALSHLEVFWSKDRTPCSFVQHIFWKTDTLPETSTSYLKIGRHSKKKCHLPTIGSFSGKLEVSFRECIIWSVLSWLSSGPVTWKFTPKNSYVWLENHHFFQRIYNSKRIIVSIVM